MQNVDNRITMFLVSKALAGVLTSVAEIAEATGVEDHHVIVMSLERIMAKTMDNDRMPLITSLVVDESGLPETHFWQALGLLRADLKAKQAFARAYQAKAIGFYRDLIPFNINEGLAGVDYARTDEETQTDEVDLTLEPSKFIVGHQHTTGMNLFYTEAPSIGMNLFYSNDYLSELLDSLSNDQTSQQKQHNSMTNAEAEPTSFSERCTSPIKAKQVIEDYVVSLEGKGEETTESSKLEEEPASWEDIQRAMRFIGK